MDISLNFWPFHLGLLTHLNATQLVVIYKNKTPIGVLKRKSPYHQCLFLMIHSSVLIALLRWFNIVKGF